jgi:F-type H+-transporting ATPase subunit b
MFVTAALAAEEAAHGAGHEGGGAFPPFDPTYFASQLFWLALSFGLFYLFMSRVVIPRLGGIIENRRGRIAHDIDEANVMKSEADAAIAAYEQELSTARSKANEIGGKARDDAKAAAEAERVRIEGSIVAKMQSAEKRIGDIKAKALGNVDAIAADTAEQIVSQLLGAKFGKAEIAAAIKAVKN